MSFNQIVVFEFFSWPLFLTPEISTRWERFVCLNKISNGRGGGESRGFQPQTHSGTHRPFIRGPLVQDALMGPRGVPEAVGGLRRVKLGILGGPTWQLSTRQTGGEEA